MHHSVKIIERHHSGSRVFQRKHTSKRADVELRVDERVKAEERETGAHEQDVAELGFFRGFGRREGHVLEGVEA